MKTILICPNQATPDPIGVLADSKPLITLPMLGESFISYWLEHLAGCGVKEVRLVTTDETEAIEEVTGQAARWGIDLDIFHEVRDLTPAEARKRYRASYETDWLAAPDDAIEIDHLPGLPEQKLFTSYRAWFSAASEWLLRSAKSKRLGWREIGAGIWASRRARIAESARLIAPCWLGENVQIGKNAVIGPGAILEERVVVDQSAEVLQSWVGPDTFLGALTRVEDSLGWGDTLIDWQTGSHTRVPDSFLMCSLVKKHSRLPRQRTREAVSAPAALPRPIEAVISLVQKIQS